MRTRQEISKHISSHIQYVRTYIICCIGLYTYVRMQYKLCIIHYPGLQMSCILARCAAAGYNYSNTNIPWNVECTVYVRMYTHVHMCICTVHILYVLCMYICQQINTLYIH